MKIKPIICNAVIITLVALLLCYVFGSLMCANFDITAWNPDIRIPVFAVGLFFTIICNFTYLVSNLKL
jgi:hypothetical protein